MSAEKVRYALVTGASRGIGKALVEELLQKDLDLRIFAVARGKQDLEKLASGYPERVIPIAADVGQADGIQKMLEVVRLTMSFDGVLSYLIHNAGIVTPLGDCEYLQKQSISLLLSQMETSYRTNVIAPHLLTLALLPELQKAPEARILLISSRAGDIAVPGIITYSCAKAALDHLALNLQSSLADSIGVGLLIPGEVDTDMQGDLRTPPEDQFASTTCFREAKVKNQLLSPNVSAKFIVHLLYETSLLEFSKGKWDIYFNRPANLPDPLSQAIGSPPPYL